MINIPRHPDSKPLGQWLADYNRTDLSMEQRLRLRQQVGWVEQHLRNMVLKTLMSRLEAPRMVDPNQFLTVDGSYMYMGQELPVYRFDMNGVTIKLRYNTQDWCVVIWGLSEKVGASAHIAKEFLRTGDYSDLAPPKHPGDESIPYTSFCVGSSMILYSALWDILFDQREAKDAEISNQEQLNHYVITGHADGGDSVTHYVMASSPHNAELKFAEKHKQDLIDEEAGLDDDEIDILIETVVQTSGPPLYIETRHGIQNIELIS